MKNLILLALLLPSIGLAAWQQEVARLDSEQAVQDGRLDDLDAAVAAIGPPPSSIEGQVLTVIPLASELRYLFADYYRRTGVFPFSNETAGAPSATDIQNDFVSSVGVNGTVITATFGNNADPAIQNATLTFVPLSTGNDIYYICSPDSVTLNYFSLDACVFVDDPPEPITTIRKQVATAIPLASEARWLTVDYFQHTGFFPFDNAQAGADAPANIVNDYVSSVSIAPSGTVTATFGNNAAALISGHTMTFTPTDNGGSITWTCNSTVADRYAQFSIGGGGCVLPVDQPPLPITLIRQQVASGVPLAEGLEALVESYYVTNGDWPASNAIAGAPSAFTIVNNYVISVAIAADGVITVTYGNSAHLFIFAGMLTFTPTDNGGSISWHCGSGNIEARYLPFECR